MDIQLLASASAPMSVSSNSIIPLIVMLVISVFPVSSIALSILLWKRINYARGLVTLFVAGSWFALLLFFLMADVPFSFSLSLLFAPSLFGAGSLYLLWANERTAAYFGSQIRIQSSIALMKDEYSRMPQKVRILFFLFLIPALLILVGGFLIFVFIAAAGLIGQNIFFVPVILFFSAMNMFIPLLILKRIRWGWHIAIAVSFIDLFGFPIGTALGIISLYLLFSSEVKGYFGK